jgi:hypothetical protein
MLDVNSVMTISNVIVTTVIGIGSIGFLMEQRAMTKESIQMARESLRYNEAVCVMTQESVQIARESLGYHKARYVLMQENVRIARETLELNKAMYMPLIVGKAVTVRRS